MKSVDALFAQGVTTFLQLVIVTTKTLKNCGRKNMFPQEDETMEVKDELDIMSKQTKKSVG